jgi:MFS family permease
MVLVSIPLYRETYAPVIRQNARRKRAQQHDGIDLSEQTQPTIMIKLRTSLARPLRLLAFNPIIQIMTILSALEYGILYILLTDVASMWIEVYGESPGQSGLHYFAICIGEVLGALIGGPLIDYTYRLLRSRLRNIHGQAEPEFRLPLMLPGAVITPVGLLLYGWGAQHRVYWVLVDLGALLASFGMQVGGQAAQAYIIDTFPEHTSSASGASQLLRGLAGAGCPLFTPALYKALGYGWGNTAIGLVYLVTGLAVPCYMWRYGGKLRAGARVE